MRANAQKRDDNCSMATAVVLAAGCGRRLRPLTERAPKSLLVVERNNRIIDYILGSLKECLVTDVIVVVGYLHKSIVARADSEGNMNIALILAGGVGSRCGSSVPKQFVKVNGKPLIIYTLEKFNSCSLIDGICVACEDGWQDELKLYAEKYDIDKLRNICLGGRTGLESVKNGLNALSYAKPDDLILIHDAVRPFVDEETIVDNIHVAQKYGLAMASIECVETLVRTTDGTFSSEVIPRDNLRRILTPQTFKYEILQKLFRSCDIIKSKEPSVFALYMSTGEPIYCSRGNSKNIKITYLDDLEYCKKLFGEE